jgi:hypothetical protein
LPELPALPNIAEINLRSIAQPTAQQVFILDSLAILALMAILNSDE